MPITGATTNTDDGRHCCGESNSAGSSELAGEFTIYGANGTTPIAIARDSNSAAAVVAENASGEFFTGALAIRSTGIVKGATVEVSTLLRPAATADNKVQDNAVDIGVDTTNRFRDLFLGRDAKVGGTLNVTGIATFTVAPVFSAGFSGVSSIGATAISGGTITCTTNAIYQGSQQTAAVNASGASYAVGATDRFVFINLTLAVCTIALPDATLSANVGRELWFVVVDAVASAINRADLDPNGAQTINGLGAGVPLAISLKTNAMRSAHIVSNGTSWFVAGATPANAFA